MPAHNHTASTNSTGSHTHTGTAASAGAHTHTVSEYSGSEVISGVQLVSGHTSNNRGSATTSSNGAHTHSVTIQTGGAHQHTVTVNNAGSGTAHNNLPPYITAYIWRRIK